MKPGNECRALAFAGIVGVGLCGCSQPNSGEPVTQPGSGGATNTGGTDETSGGSGGTVLGGAGGSSATGRGGSEASGGAPGTGGVQGTGGGGTEAGTGGRPAGTGGALAGTGGTSPPAGSCTVGPWSEADPAVAGPYATVTENEVGPATSDGTKFTMFRPEDLAETDLCHPVVTWGNGTDCTPSIYKVLLNHLASHGFVVIASNSKNVAKGTPKPMLAGVAWVLEQNDDPTSVLYRRIDTTHIGATGHSQGGFATSDVGTDSRITTTAPACGAIGSGNMKGPTMMLCGGKDTNVPCDSTIKQAYDGTSKVATMLANSLSSSHADWITYVGSKPSAFEVAITAWMRVHLMGDTALRSWFYGSSCKLCTDTANWKVQQKLMDQ